jgi:hypothetical protein
LLIGKDKEEGIAKFILVEHPLQFFPCLRDTFPIVRVYDENDTLGVLEVCERNENIQWKRRCDIQMRNAQCLQSGRILSCPPTSQTVKEMFLYSTVSTLKPY